MPHNRVKSLRDLPKLFAKPERTKTMGVTRHKTPERLDKIIQFIWNYQRNHAGESPPSLKMISENLPEIISMRWYIGLLEQEGRLEIVGVRPLKVVINRDHPKNKAAINRFMKLLERAEALEAAAAPQPVTVEEEHQAIVAREAETATADQVETDHLSEQEFHDWAAEKEEPSLETMLHNWGEAPPAQDTVRTMEEHQLSRSITRATEAQRTLDRENTVIGSAMPQLLKIADTRDLLSELVERGYVVSKR